MEHPELYYLLVVLAFQIYLNKELIIPFLADVLDRRTDEKETSNDILYYI